MCDTTVGMGSLEKLADLVKTVMTVEEGDRKWDDQVPESSCLLLEAALTCISTLSLFSDKIRHAVIDVHHLLPYISSALSLPHIGTRYAACRCVRSLSCSISVLGTDLVDSGVGMKVFGLLRNTEEDRRVVGASLECICNLVSHFSPLRKVSAITPFSMDGCRFRHSSRFCNRG